MVITVNGFLFFEKGKEAKMRRQFLEWLSSKLNSWSERFEDWSRQVRPEPLPQYGPPTRLQMVTQTLLDEQRQKWPSLLDEQRQKWPFQWDGAKPGSEIKIRLPIEYSLQEKKKEKDIG